MTIQGLQERKAAGRPIVATTAYDHWSALRLAEAGLDFLLVGDSVAMVVHGHPSTREATVEMMVAHTAAVRRGAPDALLVTDLPWPAMEGGAEAAEGAGVALREAGADAVKVEALPGHEAVVRGLLARGIPVMGHVGLLPQTVASREGYRVKGRGEEAAGVRAAARGLEEAGCFALVLECVPAGLAREITGDLRIPTIGIGAGSRTDGQILVLHDLAGFTGGDLPRFVRRFGEGGAGMVQAVEGYAAAVREGRFPTEEESYR